MPQAIRNFCIARGSIAAATPTFVYTCPANFSTIVRSIYLSPTGGTPTQLVVQMRTASSGGFVVNILFPRTAPADPWTWEGWFVINSGDLLLINSTGAAVVYWISGAVLPYAPANAIPVMGSVDTGPSTVV